MSSSIFETLPPELLLNVALHLPDLECLDNLLRASPAFWRLFDGSSSFAVEIVDQALEAALLEPQTKTIIRTIAHAYSDSLPAANIDQLQRRVTNNSLTHRFCNGENVSTGARRQGQPWFHCLDEVFSPLKFPKNCRPSIVRHILMISRHVSFMTQDHLGELLSQFRKLRPPKTVHDIGPPTWMEEQAVTRAFWRLEFARCIGEAARNGLLTWDSHERNDLDFTDMHKFYNSRWLRRDIAHASSRRRYPIMLGQYTEHNILQELAQHYKSDPPPTDWTRSQPAALPRPGDYDVLEDHWSPGEERIRELIDDKAERKLEHGRLGLSIWSAERLDGFGFIGIDCGSKEDREKVLRAWAGVADDAGATELRAHARRLLIGLLKDDTCNVAQNYAC
ncbi:hypothetical protein ANO11243_029950 [Dothideomycetidae sp. 11243]|nr:hypothetical protein ANO11243_029950 [fungal sp. No.11243]